MNNQVWVAGTNKDEKGPCVAWELIGVFDNQQLAIDNCTKPNDFVGPVELNVPFPEETCQWTGLYYPLQTT